MSNATISPRNQAFIIMILALAGIVIVTVLAFVMLLPAMGPFLASTACAIVITIIAVVASRLVHNRLVTIP